MEEYFALKFGKWIKNSTKSDFSEVFNNNILKEGTKILFDPNNKSKSIKDLYGKKLSDVWLNFNSEIALYLKENKTLDNYILDTNLYKIDLSFKDSHTPLINYNLNIKTNEEIRT